MAAESTTMLKIGAYAPMALLFIILVYLYAVYMATFIIPLLNGTYTMNSELQNAPSTAPLFLTMKQISSQTNNIIGLFQSQEIELTPEEQKGAIYCAIIHVLIIFLSIGVFRSIHTDAGVVPEKWSETAEKDFIEAIEVEKRKLRSMYQRSKLVKPVGKDGEIIVQDQNILIEGKKELREDNSVIQGGQGADQTSEPNDSAQNDLLHQQAVYYAMRDRRFCNHCQKFKPERTHHCRQCDSCVLKMDHHCPWVGRCVGFYNYKYFLNMVFYGVVLLWFVSITYTEMAIDSLFNLNISAFSAFFIFFTYLFAFVLGIVLTGFMFFHLWLISRGKTTLEYCEDKKKANYDSGIYTNFKASLGTNPLLWFVPFVPNYEGEGVTFTPKEARED